MKLLYAHYWQLPSTSIVRDNLMKEKGYTGYCPNWNCTMPRTKFNGDQFVCPCCGWISQYPIGFIIEYKRKWNLK